VNQSSGGNSGGFIVWNTPCSDVTYGPWSSPVNGYQFRDVLAQNPQGCVLTNAQQAARTRKVGQQILGLKYYPDGSLLRSPDWNTYIIVDGKKKLIRNWDELCKNYKGQEIFNVSFDVLAQYPGILGIKVYAEGSLLRDPDQKVYVIIGGKKKRVLNWEGEFKKYRGQKINDTSFETLASYPNVIEENICENCRLLRTPDWKTYVYMNGKVQPVRSWEELYTKYRGLEINNVTYETLKYYPDLQVAKR